MSYLSDIADHIIHIKNGEKIYEGAKDDFIENYLIVKGAREELKGLDRDILIGTRTYENGFVNAVNFPHWQYREIQLKIIRNLHK